VRVVVLDLDDTLYLEREYVRSGFHAVGAHVARLTGVRGFGERCWAMFEAGHRGSTFDVVVTELGLDVPPSSLVDEYRRHEPTIRLLPDAERFLSKMTGDVPMAVLTDGAPASQRAKIRALGLEDLVDHIVVTDELGGVHLRKPHPAGFEAVMAAFPDVEPREFTYLADNPGKDLRGALDAGWCFLRIRRPGGLHVDFVGDPAHEAVVDLDEAYEILVEQSVDRAAGST
jgi:putative hydrolase of the HAD superfamily